MPRQIIRSRFAAPVYALILASSMLACGAEGLQHAGRPNVLLITVDSLRADRLGYAGYERAQTPHMDALAERGTAFTAAWTPVPVGSPALACVLTGQYPATHGVTTSQGRALPAGSTTLAEYVHALGYRTGAFVASLALHPKYGFDQGFDVYSAAFARTPRPSQIPAQGLPAGKVTERALEFLEGAREGPFFLWVNYFDPHYFYSPPEPFATRFADSPYDGEVANVDENLGRILEKLADYGIAGDTIVVLAGTNGEGLGDHGELYHGTTLQTATTKVPLVIVGPGFAPGARVDTPVSLVDLAPTVLGLLRITPSDTGTLEGIPLTRMPAADRPIYLETHLPDRMFGWEPLYGVLSGEWKLVAASRSELFDLATDPGEESDVLSSVPAIGEKLGRLLAAYRAREETAEAIDASVPEAIRALGLPDGKDPARAARDPRDLIAVANDALKAHRSAQRRQLQAATFLFRKVLERDPDNYIGLLDSSLLAVARRDEPRRRELLEKLQRLYPDRAEAYHQLGHAALGMQAGGGQERADRLFDLAVRLDPKNEEALYDRACGLALKGDTQSALDTLEKAVAEGFRDFEWMGEDSDLDSLREDPRFQAIMKEQTEEKAEGTTRASGTVSGR